MSSLSVDQISNLAGDQRFGPVALTPVTPTSGSTIDFTGIPDWVKRIVVLTSNLGTSSTGIHYVQLGDSGGIETTGYNGSILAAIDNANCNTAKFTTRHEFTSTSNAAGGTTARVNIEKVTGNLWVISSNADVNSATYHNCHAVTAKTLSGTLTQFRLGLSAGTYASGTIGGYYE